MRLKRPDVTQQTSSFKEKPFIFILPITRLSFYYVGETHYSYGPFSASIGFAFKAILQKKPVVDFVGLSEYKTSIMATSI